jgi:hypothetical protein
MEFTTGLPTSISISRWRPSPGNLFDPTTLSRRRQCCHRSGAERPLDVSRYTYLHLPKRLLRPSPSRPPTAPRIMRLLPFLPLLPLAFARSHSSAQQPIQVYLHPTPPSQHLSAAPTLTPEQAKAVLSHHLGEGLSDFDEIPADEGVWGHLVGAWNGLWAGEGERGRVVIIEGGVQAQGGSHFQ